MQSGVSEEWLFAIAVVNPGGVLLSHTASRAVPSAPKSLTSEFGMGSGVASSKSPPETCGIASDAHALESAGQPSGCEPFAIPIPGASALVNRSRYAAHPDTSMFALEIWSSLTTD